tara:strand:- start:210 stop:458 length:249 start_codon:yes stop_codon:yes gene_type:complete
MLEKYIKLNYFLISFSIGMLYVYLVQPPKEIVHRHPNPNNTDIIYTDKNNTCYKYKVEKRNCNELNKNEIESQPLLEDFKHN